MGKVVGMAVGKPEGSGGSVLGSALGNVKGGKVGTGVAPASTGAAVEVGVVGGFDVPVTVGRVGSVGTGARGGHRGRCRGGRWLVAQRRERRQWWRGRRVELGRRALSPAVPHDARHDAARDEGSEQHGEDAGGCARAAPRWRSRERRRGPRAGSTGRSGDADHGGCSLGRAAFVDGVGVDGRRILRRALETVARGRWSETRRCVARLCRVARRGSVALSELTRRRTVTLRHLARRRAVARCRRVVREARFWARCSGAPGLRWCRASKAGSPGAAVVKRQPGAASPRGVPRGSALRRTARGRAGARGRSRSAHCALPQSSGERPRRDPAGAQARKPRAGALPRPLTLPTMAGASSPSAGRRALNISNSITPSERSAR